jgi:hypothetical protein
MRRLTGILTSLLLFHLTLVGADLACAKHGLHHASSSARADRGGHEQHHQHATQSDIPARDDASCEVPTLPACCQALASCGMSLAGNAATGGSDVLLIAGRVRTVADDVPPSWSLEPEPPPPRA